MISGPFKGFFLRKYLSSLKKVKATGKRLRELLPQNHTLEESKIKSGRISAELINFPMDQQTYIKSEPLATMNMCVKTAKSKIREEMKKTISSISSEEQGRQSNIIVDKLLSLTSFKDSKRVCVYLSMKNEVQTDKIVEDILSSGRTCFIPRYTKTDMEMVKLHSLQDLRSLPMTKWNIRQPSLNDDRENAMDFGLDLMIVPGLAFTENGSRLGRGKGYYDRYLEEYHKTTGRKLKTIGLAFKQQILNELPVDTNDFKLDLVIYPGCNLSIVSPEVSKDYDFDGFK